MRANTHNVQGEQETRGVGEGGENRCGTETLGDLWKGEGWPMGQDGHHRDFQQGKQGI